VGPHIQKLHPRKAQGFDGIDSRIAKALPKKGILFLVLLVLCCDNDDTNARKTAEPCPVLPTDKLASQVL